MLHQIGCRWSTEAGGSAVSFDVAGGSALGALGWTAGTVSGHDSALEIEISGKYTGSGNGELRFVPSGDGVIGTTPGLEVLVYDTILVIVPAPTPRARG